MSIKFDVVERGRPGHDEAPKKYYPSIQSTCRVTMRELAREASKISTLSSPDMMAAIEAFLTLIPGHLAEGKIVDLGDFCNFWLCASARREPIRLQTYAVTRSPPSSHVLCPARSSNGCFVRSSSRNDADKFGNLSGSHYQHIVMCLLRHDEVLFETS